jgi:hypothetical protein
MPTSSGREGWKTVSLRTELLQRVEKVREAKQEGKTRKIPLGTLVEDLLLPELERNEALRHYAPFLEQVGIEDDVIFLKDNRLLKIVELRVRDGDLYCGHDRSKSCVHIGFAWSIPRVYKVMKEHGSKRPK